MLLAGGEGAELKTALTTAIFVAMTRVVEDQIFERFECEVAAWSVAADVSVRVLAAVVLGEALQRGEGAVAVRAGEGPLGVVTRPVRRAVQHQQRQPREQLATLRTLESVLGNMEMTVIAKQCIFIILLLAYCTCVNKFLVAMLSLVMQIIFDAIVKSFLTEAAVYTDHVYGAIFNQHFRISIDFYFIIKMLG